MKIGLLLITSFVMGAAGGIVGSYLFLPSRLPSVQTIQATRYELLDAKGNVRAFWGTDRDKNTVLAFTRADGGRGKGDIDDPAQQRTSIGILSDGTPWFSFVGADGRSRVRFYLSEFEKPIMLLEDASSPRLSLGIDQSDSHNARDNDWALKFYDPSSATEKASIGMLVNEQHLRGYMELNGEPFVTSLARARTHARQ